MTAFTEANRKAFDDLAASYGTAPWQLKLADQVATALQSRREWLGLPSSPAPTRQIRLLDYACGTGAITKALGPHVSQIRGVDVSERMVEKYNEAARASGLAAEQAHAVAGDLCAEAAVPEHLLANDFFNFDLAAIGLGFHHFEHSERAMRRLGERLKAQTGVLVIVDFLPSDPAKDEGEHFTPMEHTIKQNGFSGDRVRELYQSAGFEDFDIVALKEPALLELESGTVKRTLFIARGRKGATAWQKISGWVGEMQDWAARGVKMEADTQKWNPGLANEGREVWSVEKQKDETYNAMDRDAPEKTWNGF